MWEIFNTPAFAPFVIAGLVLVILLAVELLGFFFGGLSGFLDNILPDSLLDADFDADTDMNMDANTDLSIGLKALDWLYVGRIPTMILLILFITSFCITGLIIQQVSFAVLGHYLSPWLASLDALVISVPVLKLLASLLYPILPKDESSAVSGDSFVGRQVRIILGYASIGSPAQAKLTDDHGQTHYLMVEPDPIYNSYDSHALSSAPVQITIDSDIHHGTDNNNTESNSSNETIITADDTLIITKRIGERYLVKKL